VRAGCVAAAEAVGFGAGVLHAAAVVAVLVAQTATPQPQVTPLKEITRVKTRALCTVLHDRIAPSIAALLENDAALTQGVGVLQGQARLDERAPIMGNLHLENDVAIVAHNLETIDDLLKTSPDAAKSEGADRDSIALLERQLQSIEDAERAELNVFNGVLETVAMTNLMAESDHFTINVGAPGTPADPSLGVIIHPLRPSGSINMAEAATGAIGTVEEREQRFTQTLLPLAAQCRPEPEAASPGPSAPPK
jgi:hypothetical protein